jgi:hypothetical protein
MAFKVYRAFIEVVQRRKKAFDVFLVERSQASITVFRE